MKLITLLLLNTLLFFSQNSASQNGCDGLRYKANVFTAVDTTFNVLFGRNTTPAGVVKNLYMDIYEPKGDNLSNRPVIVWAFGGSFVGGNRTQVAALCNESAQKGFVAVAIDYRLLDDFFPLPDSLDFIDISIKAMGDMKAAIRKLRQDAANGNPYHIDPNFIVAAGISAGAITAHLTAETDIKDPIPPYILKIINNNGGINGNSSNNYQYSSEVQAVLGFSGALPRANWFDADDPPIYCVHDDNDPTVPYNTGYATVTIGNFTFNVLYMEGSLALHNKAVSFNTPTELITIPNSAVHVSYFQTQTPYTDIAINNSFNFLYDLICGGTLNVATTNSKSRTLVYPNPTKGQININLDYSEVKGILIYNTLNQLVSNQLDISDEMNGLYIIKIATKSGIITAKIIKE